MVCTHVRVCWGHEHSESSSRSFVCLHILGESLSTCRITWALTRGRRMDHSLGYDGFRDFTRLPCSAHSISRWAPRVDWCPHQENPQRWQQRKEEVCAAFLRNTAWPQPLGLPKGASRSQSFPPCPLEPRAEVPGTWYGGRDGEGGAALKPCSCHGNGESHPGRPIHRAHPGPPPPHCHCTQ